MRILTPDARTPQTKAETLFGLRVRGRRGSRTGHCCLLRRGGRAVGGIRGAAGDECDCNASETGDNDFFHRWIVGLMFNLQSRMTHRLVLDYGV